MHNILIPTAFEADTLYAVKTAVKHAETKNCTIVLVTISDLPDTLFSPLSALRSMSPEMTEAQYALVDECRAIVKETANCTLTVRHQFGISAPLLKNLLNHLEIGLVILSQRYRSETNTFQRHFLKLLGNCKSPILHLGQHTEEHHFNNALYLERAANGIGVQDLQRIVSERFTFKIVSQASVFEERPEEITPFLSETISKNNIDLLVETRKPEKTRLKKNAVTPVHQNLGLPVLSLHEETV